MKHVFTKTISPSKLHGFSLLELMIGISILAILLGIGIPSFLNTIRSNQITAQTNELVTSLALARSEATKRGSTVSLCTASGAACSGTTNWNNGWLVFADVNGDGNLDPGDTLLQTSSKPTSGMNVVAVDTSSSSSVASLTYFSTGAAVIATTFTISKTGCSAQQLRQITVDSTGRAHLDKKDC